MLVNREYFLHSLIGGNKILKTYSNGKLKRVTAFDQLVENCIYFTVSKENFYTFIEAEADRQLKDCISSIMDGKIDLPHSVIMQRLKYSPSTR